MKNNSFINKGLIFVLFLASISVVANHWIASSEKLSTIETQAAEFTLKDLQGKNHSLRNYRGKGVVVNFWATYCPPCEREFPAIESVYQQYKGQEIEILAVNVEETLRTVDPFIAKRDVSFPVLLDRHGEVASAYDVINLPVTFFINSKGEIVSQVSGEISEEILHENIKNLK